jgi:hypothetical protein
VGCGLAVLDGTSSGVSQSSTSRRTMSRSRRRTESGLEKGRSTVCAFALGSPICLCLCYASRHLLPLTLRPWRAALISCELHFSATSIKSPWRERACGPFNLTPANHFIFHAERPICLIVLFYALLLLFDLPPSLVCFQLVSMLPCRVLV